MKKKSENIIQRIKEDHKPLKAAIQILTSEKKSEAEKKRVLPRFLKDLKLHSKAEEMSVYSQVLNMEETRDTALEGFEEHHLADLLSHQLEKNADSWSDTMMAKAKVLAELIQHHIKEEEDEFLPELKEALEKDQLLQMGDLYNRAYRELKKELASTNGTGAMKKKASRRPGKEERMAEIFAPAPH
jgi:hemerythrin superfamily protein